MSVANDYIRPDILAQRAYSVEDGSGMIKLDAMENPYPLPAELQTQLGQVLGQAALNRYPDPQGRAVQAALRQAMDIPPAASLMLGNGSDELISLLCQALAKPDALLLCAEPSFVMYKVSAQLHGMRYVGVPLREDFSLDLAAMLAAIGQHRPALIFLAYPNNPTGPRYQRADVAAIIEAAPGLVVIDEAYSVFADDSWLAMAGSLPNVLVMRTLSKLGLAGIRLGYMAGPAPWLEQIDKVRPPYNVNVLSQAAACFALQNLPLFRAQAGLIVQERARMQQALGRLAGIQVFNSEANFLLIRVSDAPKLFEHLKRSGILVKLLHGYHPMLAHCLRLTIGRPQENDAVLNALNVFAGTQLA